MKRLVSPPFTFLALLMLAWALASCRPDAGVRDALLRAEALMESDPHAARALLDSIASPNPPLKGRASESTGLPSFRRGKGEAALYALLRTQADYKCRVRLTSDSLPLIARSGGFAIRLRREGDLQSPACLNEKKGIVLGFELFIIIFDAKIL